MVIRRIPYLFVAVLAILVSVRSAVAQTVRIGYFPNLTHASAILGLADGSFQAAVGPGVTFEAKTFNAGPSVIEAMFAGSLDLAWVGPNPAINGYLKSGGEVLVVAGACTGGASLIVRAGAGIARPADVRGKRVGTPQLGNTQDVACRAWLRALGLKPSQPGADVQVIPVANADQLALFQKGSLDAVWAVEPWASRLVLEGKGRVLLDEAELWNAETRGRYVTANLIASKAFVTSHRPLLVALLRAHVRETLRARAHPRETLAVLARELVRISGGSLPPAVLVRAWSRVTPTWDPVRLSLRRYADWGFAEGFLGRTKPDLAGLYELGPLAEALKAEGQPALQ